MNTVLISGIEWPLHYLDFDSDDHLFAQCPECDGVGRIWNLPFNPSEREGWATCPKCDGEGKIELNPTEEELDRVKEQLKGEQK